MKPFVWDVKNNLISITDTPPENNPDGEFLTGELYNSEDGTKIVLHQDNANVSASIDYFIELWNALYPSMKVSLSDISLGMSRKSSWKIKIAEGTLSKLDYNQFPIFGHYMNSPGHINPEEDPQMMKNRKQIVGDLGELIVKKANIPGLTVLKDKEHDVDHPNHPMDILFNYDVGSGLEPFAAEIKAASSHNARPYRYSLTGYGRKSSKQAAIDKLSHSDLWKNYSPAMIGITMRYDDNMADVYMLPHTLGSFSRSTKGAIPLAENMPFDFNGFHPDPYHLSRPEEKRRHGVDWQEKFKESPNPEDLF